MFVVISSSLREFVDAYNSNKKYTAKTYFNVLNLINSNLNYFRYFLILLTQKKPLEDCVNQVVQPNCIGPEFIKRSKYYLFTVYLLMSSFIWIPVPFTGGFGDNMVSPKEALNAYIRNGRYRFFLDNSKVQYTLGNALIGTVEIICRLTSTQITWVFSVFFAGPLPVIFWLTVKDFEEFVKEALSSLHDKTLVNINEKFEAMKNFGNSVNQVWSMTALFWLLDIILESLLALNDLVSSRNFTTVMGFLVWIISVGMLLLLSGETYRKVGENNLAFF